MAPSLHLVYIMLNLAAPRTTTPPGSPPRDFIPLNDAPNVGSVAAAPQDTSSILQALANMAKSNVNVPGQTDSTIGNSVPAPFASGAVNPTSSMPPFGAAVNAYGAANSSSNQYGGTSSTPNFAQAFPQMNMQATPAPQTPAPPPQNSFPTPEQLQQQIQIVQMLQQQGIPQDQWGPVVQALMAASLNMPVGTATQAPNNQNYSQNDIPRESNAYGMRSPPGRDRFNNNRRSRSRSPTGYDRRREESPRRRRNSPTYGAFGRGDDRSYRQRSPERNDRIRRSDSPERDRRLPAPGPKSITWDNSIPPDHIKGKFLRLSDLLLSN